MLNIAICADDIEVTGYLEGLLYKNTESLFIQMDTEVFGDGRELVKAVSSGIQFDLIYLGIEMRGQDGISAAKEIRQIDSNVLIVYVTSHSKYMLDSFEVRPFRFLLKPVNEKIFIDCFYKCIREIAKENYYLRYKYQKTNYKILSADILYFESQKRKIRIVTVHGTDEMYGRMDEIQKYMEKGNRVFLRVHQSFLVNYDHIRQLASDKIIMDNGCEIPISVNRRKDISGQYGGLEKSIIQKADWDIA